MKVRYLAFLVLIGFTVWYAFRVQKVGFDFQCFYDVGQRWLAGESLYFTSEISGLCEPQRDAPKNLAYKYRTGFYYTPASVAIFLPLRLFSQRASMVLFTVLNILALIFIFFLVEKRVFSSFQRPPPWSPPSPKEIWIIRGSVILLMFNSIQMGLDFAQTTIFVFLLICLADHFLQKQKPYLSGICFVLAVVLKIFPGILIFYLLLNRSKETIRKVAASAFITLVCLCIVMLPYRDLFLDFTEFIIAIQAKASRVNTDLINQSLLPALFRFFTTDYFGNQYFELVTLVEIDKNALRWIHHGLALVSFMIIVRYNFSERLRPSQKTHGVKLQKQVVIFSLYLLWLIIFNPVSWLHYHILALPAVYYLLVETSSYRIMIQRKVQEVQKVDFKRIFKFFVITCLILSNVLTGRDIIGQKLDILRAYSHALFSNLLLFITLLWELKSLRNAEK